MVRAVAVATRRSRHANLKVRHVYGDRGAYDGIYFADFSPDNTSMPMDGVFQ